MSNKSQSFYAGKKQNQLRFFYRHLRASLHTAVTSAEREKALTDFLSVLAQSDDADALKMKWVLPDFLKSILSPSERETLEARLADMRTKRNRRLMGVYPLCADEINLTPAFLDAAFDGTSTPIFDRNTPIFTIGSCFARNIATYLADKGYNSTVFEQSENLNSPLSNALMLSAAAAPADEREAYLRYWIAALFTGNLVSQREGALKSEINHLEFLRDAIAESRLLIITLGNTVDFFLTEESIAPFLGDTRVAPKFLTVTSTEDINQRAAISTLMKNAGAQPRMGSFNEAVNALRQLYGALRAINPTAPVLFTLSPVPLDNAMGLSNSGDYGAIELDCISKSTLRAAIAEVLPEFRAEGRQAFYFPSYEIVRWVGPMQSYAIFGVEDAAARHVSDEILHAIFDFFLRKHGKRVT